MSFTTTSARSARNTAHATRKRHSGTQCAGPRRRPSHDHARHHHRRRWRRAAEAVGHIGARPRAREAQEVGAGHAEGQAVSQTIDDALHAFLAFRAEYHGVSPTVREFRERLGLRSPVGATYWFSQLEANGYIEHAIGPGYSRDYIPTIKGWNRATELARVEARSSSTAGRPGSR